MPLPDFNDEGDLPRGLHQATIDEIITRFSTGTPQRQAVTTRLTRIYNLVQATGKLERFIIFGSFITNKPDPNDVDIVLVMGNDFSLNECDEEARMLFDHTQAALKFGRASFGFAPRCCCLSHWMSLSSIGKSSATEPAAGSWR